MKNFWIIIFLTSLWLSGCAQEHSNELDTIFEKLEKNSPKMLLEEFKKDELEDILKNDFKYKAIFEETLDEILKDSIEENKLRECFSNYGTELVGEPLKWTFVTAFHRYVNDKSYHIKSINDQMIERRYKTN